MGKEDTVQEIVESISRLMRPMEHQAWKSLGLSRAHVGMLYMLHFHPDASVNQLAQSMEVSKAAVTQLISPLLNNAYVIRETDPTDRRIARLNLTAKGKDMLKKIKKLKTAGLRAALGNLSDSQLQQLADLHQAMGSKS